MENKINSIVQKFRSDRIRRRRVTALLTGLSMIVSSSVFWQLRSTGNALTDEYLCGMTEHVHSAECFSEELNCTEDHEHTDECSVIVLNCEKTGHTHSMQCMSDISADIESAEDWEATLPETFMGNLSENLTAVAASQLGYCESVRNFVLDSDSVRRGYTRYGQWYGSSYGEWNTMFTYFCLYYAGITQEMMPYGSGCWAWTETLSETGLFANPNSGEIKVGDLVFFDTDADDKPDRSGIVSAISKPDDEEEDSPQTITVIEGDLADKVDEAEYSMEDEKLVGFVSIDKLAESDMESQTLSPKETEIELPMLPFSAPEFAVYANSGNTKITIGNDNANNYQDQNQPYRMTAGESITLTAEVSVNDQNANCTRYDNEAAFNAAKEQAAKNGDNTLNFIQLTNGVYMSTYARFQNFGKGLGADTVWNDPRVEMTTTYEYIDNGPKIKLTAVLKTNNDTSVDYTAHIVEFQQAKGYSNYERLWIDITPVPETTEPQPTGTKVKVISPKEADNNYQTAASAYRLRQNESVTIQASVGPDKYTKYASLEEYNNAKEANKNDSELRFAQIGNTYISTYARFWGVNENTSDSPICQSSYTTYSMNGDSLVATVTYSAKDIKYNQNNKYIVSFIDNKDDYNTIEQFWINVEVPIISVYTNVGWKDKDLIHEAMEGVGGDTAGGKYWSNADVKEREGGSMQEGQYYIVHPGDWIYLSGIGNGAFKNLRQIGGDVNDLNGMRLENNVAPPKGDKSGKTNIWKLTMPNTSSGKAYYAVDYTVDNSTQTFYFMFANTGLWGTAHFDHADFEIADGGIYEMIAQHYIKPDGTEIKTVRTYDSYVQDVQESKVFDASGNLVGNYLWGDYSKQGEIGETQFEYTSKYKTDGNQNRLPPTEDSNGFPPSHSTDEPLKTWSRVNTDSAEFTVDILLKPKSEVTIIKYPDGREEQLLTDSQTLSTYEEMTVKNVKIALDRQSVIDAVNKCPNHSGLDFTVLDEQIVTKLRSGNVLIEAYKLFKDSQGNELNEDLVGGEFEFELYEYDPSTESEKLVCSSTNVAEGYVYFKSQFYIDLDMSNDEPKEFFYRIKEKIPYVYLNVKDQNKTGVTYFYKTEKTVNGEKIVEYTEVSPYAAPDRLIYVTNKDNGYDKYIKRQAHPEYTYSEHTENVKVTVTPTLDADKRPIYTTSVEYIDMQKQQKEDQDDGKFSDPNYKPEYKHTYTPKDSNGNPVEADRTVPMFVNTMHTYTLPSTGGSGTTMFFVFGPMLMVGSAVIALRRKRKERV